LNKPRTTSVNPIAGLHGRANHTPRGRVRQPGKRHQESENTGKRCSGATEPGDQAPRIAKSPAVYGAIFLSPEQGSAASHNVDAHEVVCLVGHAAGLLSHMVLPSFDALAR